MQFFADEADVPLLLARLNDDPELAFIIEADSGVVPVSNARWRRSKVVPRTDVLTDGRHRLWHIAGNPLSADRDNVPAGTDPSAGWVEVEEHGPRASSLRPMPASSVIHLTLWSRHRPYSAEEVRTSLLPMSFWLEGREFLACSDFNWIGNRYGSIGSPAHPATTKWWNRLRRWMRANATPLTVHRQVTFYAFPSALRRLQSGVAYSACGWDLGRALPRP